MDPIERELRKKLRGLRTSHSRNRLGFERPSSKERAKHYRAKLKQVDHAIKEVERQIDSYLQQKMTPAPSAVIKQPGEGYTIAVVGDVYRFLATGDDTNGKYAMWEAIVPPSGGPPPHVHSREEEGFCIMEGEITVQIGEKRITASAGIFANMPVGTPHSFKNESDHPAQMLIFIAPAGLEKMFIEVGVPVAQGATSAPPTTKEEIAKMLAVAPRYGIEIRLPED